MVIDATNVAFVGLSLALMQTQRNVLICAAPGLLLVCGLKQNPINFVKIPGAAARRGSSWLHWKVTSWALSKQHRNGLMF